MNISLLKRDIYAIFSGYISHIWPMRNPFIEETSIWWDEQSLFFGITDSDCPLGAIPIISFTAINEVMTTTVLIEYFFREDLRFLEMCEVNDRYKFFKVMGEVMNNVPEGQMI